MADGSLIFDTKINQKSFQQDANKLSSSLKGVQTQLKKIATVAAAAFSIKQVIAFTNETKKAWQVQLEAETKLTQVMKNTMGATQEQIQVTKEWASELQKVGIIGDEITLSGLQELGTYVENADSLKTMSVVLDDMLAQQYGLNATAENAVSISTMLGKVLEGQTSALSRYGYKFDEAQEQLLKYGTEEQRVATLAEVVEASVGGMNEALARTPAGRLKQISNNMGDVKEQIGQAVTNIQAAFLPVLERLANTLAQVADLAVRASESLAAVFGVELGNSAAVTSNISASVSAQEDLTSAVEDTAKAQQSLAGFDKINTLSSQSSQSQANGSSIALPAVIDETPAEKKLDKLTDRLEKMIEPIQIAWEDKSPELIANAQRAADTIKGIFKSAGKSISEVWTNGSGQRLAGNVLTLFSDVLGIIGDISQAVKNAWDDGGRGTALIQSYADRWNSCLELVHAFADSLRDAWNDGSGELMLGNILDILTNINNFWTNIRNQMKNAWAESGRGTSIISGIYGIINSILTTIKNAVKATADWARNIDFSPVLDAISGFLAQIEPLTDNIGEGLLWFYENVLLPLSKWTLEKAVPTFLDMLSGAISALNSAISVFKPMAKFLIDSFLKPIAKWTGGVIISVLKTLASMLKTIGDWMSQHKKLIEGIAIAVGSVAAAIGILLGAQAIAGLIAALPVLLGMIVAQTTALIANAAAWLAASWPILAIVAAIAAVIAIGVLLIKHWDEIKEFVIGVWGEIKNTLSEVAGWFKDLFTKAWEGIKKAWSNVAKWFSDLWDNIKKIFSVVVNFFKTVFSGAWDAITSIFSAVGGWFRNRWEDIKEAFSTVGTWFRDIFQGAWDMIKMVFSNPGEFFSEVWEAIKRCFSHVTDWFKDTFSAAWQAVKDVFSRGGAIFQGIAENIAEVFKGIVNSLIDGINWVIAQPFNGINWALGKIRDVEILGLTPFDWIPEIGIPEIPHLAQGTVIPANYGNFLAMLGDNKREAEVVSPVSAIEKAVENVMAKVNGTQIIHVHLDLDGREIGRVAVRAVNADNARKGR